MKSTLTHCVTAVLFALLVGGCTNGGGATSDIITTTPGNWQDYENRTVKLYGNAANSPAGPFLRLSDGTSLKVAGIPIWTIDYATRPVGVEGKIVKGTDAFADRYVLQIEKYYRIQTDQQPVTIAPPEPQQPSVPRRKSKDKKK